MFPLSHNLATDSLLIRAACRTRVPPKAEREKAKSHEKRNLKRKREEEEKREAAEGAGMSWIGGLKKHAIKRLREALEQFVAVQAPLEDLPHAKQAWTSNRAAEDYPPAFDAAEPTMPEDEYGMEGAFKTQGGGGQDPRSPSRKIIPSTALKMVNLIQPSLAAYLMGVGRRNPAGCITHPKNEAATKPLLNSVHFGRIVAFTYVLFALWQPELFVTYAAAQAAFSARRPHTPWPFHKSVFAACTFNLINAATGLHLDFANLVWGWCAITALGNFNPDEGGFLIISDLKLMIRFPPGSTILLPSALLRHRNIRVRPWEMRSSFTQYSAGGIFRWLDNGGRTDKEFEATATQEEKEDRAERDSKRWEEGVSKFLSLDEIKAYHGRRTS
ncbi:hypothetical protein HMN09_00852800 [Mycena chlorophos]|uniref:Uncharacterized protein n=1 Tax=Mycena chlorophos TaxID=658473 RepID=A0A8H6W4D4_MYCCL|nr:hypothetical protein HMN09_00852800 [Mycena chlorophos]